MIFGIQFDSADAVWAIAILVLAIAVWRGNSGFRRQSRDVREVIEGQHAILDQFEDQQARIEKLTREVERLRRMDA